MCLGETVAFNCGHFETTGQILRCDRAPCKPENHHGKKKWVNTPCQACRVRQNTRERLIESTSASGSQTMQRSSTQVNQVNSGRPVLHHRREVSDMRRAATINHGQQAQQSEMHLRGGGPPRKGPDITLPPTPPPDRPLPPTPSHAPKAAETAYVVPQRRQEAHTTKQQPPWQKATLIDTPTKGKEERKSSLENLLTPQTEAETFTANTREVKSSKPCPPVRFFSQIQRRSARKYSQEDRPRPSLRDAALSRSTSEMSHQSQAGKPPMQRSTGDDEARLAAAHPASSERKFYKPPQHSSSEVETSGEQPPKFRIEGGIVTRESPGRTGTPKGIRPLKIIGRVRYGPSHTANDFIRERCNGSRFKEELDLSADNSPMPSPPDDVRSGFGEYDNGYFFGSASDGESERYQQQERDERAVEPQPPSKTLRLDSNNLRALQDQIHQERESNKHPVEPQPPVQTLQRSENAAFKTADQIYQEREKDKHPIKPQPPVQIPQRSKTVAKSPVKPAPVQIVQRSDSVALMTADQLREKRERDKLPFRPQPIRIPQLSESVALMTAEQLADKRRRDKSPPQPLRVHF